MIVIPEAWSLLAYWQSEAWQLTKEKLNETEYNPGPSMLFAALGSVRPDAVRVAILGQDPYPRSEHCSGIAFSTPSSYRRLIPPTLQTIFEEYEADLHYPAPKNGDLSKWCDQGVLLWNVYPSCSPGKPGSHHWPSWEPLTKEILERLNGMDGVVISPLGRVALGFCDPAANIVATSHPSPLGKRYGFVGSRIFSTINTRLCALGKAPIDWRL